jgi:hypothetical protein
LPDLRRAQIEAQQVCRERADQEHGVLVPVRFWVDLPPTLQQVL